MAAIDATRITRVEGNKETGSYVLQMESAKGEVEAIIVKRYGTDDVTYTRILHKEDEKSLQQRECEPREIELVTDRIAVFSDRKTSKEEDNVTRYSLDTLSWNVKNLGEAGEEFFMLYYASMFDEDLTEGSMSAFEILMFKAILGIKDFDDAYMRQYSGPLVKSAGKS